jgi:hypothetical protein
MDPKPELGGPSRAPRKTQHLSLRLRGGNDVAQHEPRATDVNADLQTDWVNDLPELHVDNIAKFNNWDHRECVPCPAGAHRHPRCAALMLAGDGVSGGTERAPACAEPHNVAVARAAR